VRWLREARRVLKPDGTLWVSGTHHIIFSLGFALQRLGFRVINNIVWSKPNPTPNALHTAFTQTKAVGSTPTHAGIMSALALAPA
jgi:site-specific DNA-methyltransferase (adenine-specific)